MARARAAARARGRAARVARSVALNDRLERFGLLAGAFSAALWVLGVFLLEAAGNPSGPANGEEVAQFYRDERVAILIAATLHTLGSFLFLWFLAALRPVLDASGAPSWLRTATLVGGTAGGALMLALTGGQSTGATTDKELVTPDAAIVFWRLAHGFFVAAEVALALFLGALVVLTLRRVILPRWLGWFGLVIAIVLLIPPLGWLALLFLFPVWLAIASVLLFRVRIRGVAARTTAPLPE